jgi:hypothetical protein
MKRISVRAVIAAFAVSIIALAASCDLLFPKSEDKLISSFTFSAAANPALGADVAGTISGTAIGASLSDTAGISALTPTIAISDKASISPASGQARDFSSPVTYVVTAEDGSKATYTVTVTALSSAKDITAFSFLAADNPGLGADAIGTITGTAIAVEVSASTALNALKPTIAASSGASVTPASGGATDFTSPASFTVTAQDGSVKVYTVTVTVTVQPRILINEVILARYVNWSIGVEFYNPGTVPADLSAYALKSKARTAGTYADAGTVTFALPALMIPAKGYALVRSKISANYVSGGLTVYLDDGASHYPWAFNEGGYIELQDVAGSTVDFVRWGSDATTPATGSFTGSLDAVAADDAHVGYSLSRDAVSTDTNAATDWALRAWNTAGGANDVSNDTDADGDGIPDSAEVSGGTFAGLPLYAWGARTGQRDIFIHIDYMDSSQDPSPVAGDLIMTPTKAALDKVKAAFAAQVPPIFIHFDAGNLLSQTAGDAANYNLDGRSHKVDWVQAITLGKYVGYGNAYEYKVRSMPLAKRQVFYYMIFGSSQNSDGTAGSSGLADINGNTSIISFGRWNVSNAQVISNYQSSTILHEFGHNLGLYHGGGGLLADKGQNYKPNYFSIMNYLYQLNGLPTLSTANTRYYFQYSQNAGNPPLNSAWNSLLTRTSWIDGPYTSAFTINYSNGTSSDLDETNLDESIGIGRSSSSHIDFNNISPDTDIGVTANITNLLSGSTDSTTLLHDFDDWAAISSVFQRQYSGFNTGASLPTSSPQSEISTARSIINNDRPTISEPCAPMPR